MEETKSQPEQPTVATDESEQTTVTTDEPEHTTVTVDQPKETSIPVGELEQTRVLMGVSQSTKGYPHPSQSSLHALDWVLSKLINKQSKGHFKLQIVHVKVPDEDGTDEVDSMYATFADFDAAKRKDLKKSIQLLQVFLKKCKEAEVPVEGWVKLGDPREVICAEVLRVKADLLILGSRGLGTVQRVFIGGVSHYCSKKAECPVLIIKRKPEDAPDDPSED